MRRPSEDIRAELRRPHLTRGVADDLRAQLAEAERYETQTGLIVAAGFVGLVLGFVLAGLVGVLVALIVLFVALAVTR